MSQLRMEKSDLDNVSVVPLPEGYLLRNYRKGDEAGLGRIYAASSLGCETADLVRERVIGHPCFRPERLFVIEHAGELVGTGAAWLVEDDPGAGYLHMVGVLREYRGKRLGAALTVAAIGYTRAEGFSRQQLDTDDWRVPALRLYLDLGYYPLYWDDTHPERWEAVAKAVERPGALVRAKDLRQQ